MFRSACVHVPYFVDYMRKDGNTFNLYTTLDRYGNNEHFRSTQNGSKPINIKGGSYLSSLHSDTTPNLHSNTIATLKFTPNVGRRAN